jgi:short-subunit dehydrogenase
MAFRFDPAQKAALVTGASSGIGAALACELARQGARLALCARRRERLEDLADWIAARGAMRPAVVDGDLASAAGRQQVLDRARDALGGIDLLVNNAGIGFRGHFHRRGAGDAAAILRLNVEAVVELAALALPDLLAHRRGALLNVASTAAFVPLPRMAVYAASKAFVLSWSVSLHEELRREGVLVTCLCPGRTSETEFSSRPGFEAPVAGAAPEHAAGESAAGEHAAGEDTAGEHAAAVDASPQRGFLRERLRAAAVQPVAGVAVEALAALRAGRALVVAGRHNRLGLALLRHLPPTGVAWLAGRVTRS